MAADRPLCDRMSGRRPFSELTKEFLPERRRRIDAIKAELLAEMPLRELRRARALTQQELAQKLQVSQPVISKLEQRTDVYISSLRSYIEAVGGKLIIVADVGEDEGAQKKPKCDNLSFLQVCLSQPKNCIETRQYVSTFKLTVRL